MIAIGADHAGFRLKEKIKEYLKEKNNQYKDFGTFNEEPCDYPLIAKAICDSVISGESTKGILICGTGIGMSIAANKIKGIKAALCDSEYLARMSRNHNDANVLCMGAKIVDEIQAMSIVDAFFNTDFEGGRHARRVKEIMDME